VNTNLTDDAVARLPLSHGRADLLEEIMRTPMLDDRPVRSERPRRRTTGLVPAAAAAVVAMLVAGTAWWAGDSGDGTAGDDGAPTRIAALPAAGDDGDYVVLAAPGWEVTARYADEHGGEMTYESGDQSLEVMWGLADSYDGYVEDRRHIVEPPADGAPLTVLGAAAQMWPYSADDHTAIREVENGQWIEFRGSGMREAGYLALLDQLELVDQASFEASLPESFVVESERTTEVDRILDGIDAVADPLLPIGVERSSITSEQNDSYQLGAELAGAVACAWLDELVDARKADDGARAQVASDVLATSHDWPILSEMNERGDYPEVLWQIADQAAAGRVPEWYAGGLGC
jgi:hypothetical protein